MTEPGDGAAAGSASIWPDRRERLRILRMWRRHKRRPDQPYPLPLAWRRQRRLAFWWTLARFVIEAPVLMLCALLAWPLWVLRSCWSFWSH